MSYQATVAQRPNSGFEKLHMRQTVRQRPFRRSQGGREEVIVDAREAEIRQLPEAHC